MPWRILSAFPFDLSRIKRRKRRLQHPITISAPIPRPSLTMNLGSLSSGRRSDGSPAPGERDYFLVASTGL